MRGECQRCSRMFHVNAAGLIRRHGSVNGGPPCPGSGLAPRDVSTKFGYQHAMQRRQLEEEVRAAYPDWDQGRVYLEAARLHPIRFPPGPSLREKQQAKRAQRPTNSGRRLSAFTAEELAYLVGRLQFQNDPIAQDILDKLERVGRVAYEVRVTLWKPMPAHGAVACRIWQEFDGRHWWQAHEWEMADGSRRMDRWIPGSRGWAPDAYAPDEEPPPG